MMHSYPSNHVYRDNVFVTNINVCTLFLYHRDISILQMNECDTLHSTSLQSPLANIITQSSNNLQQVLGSSGCHFKYKGLPFDRHHSSSLPAPLPSMKNVDL